MDDEDYALQLHKQLNAIPLRARRGQELQTQSLDRLKQRGDKASKSKTKRTNSSSQEEQPSSRKQRRTSDDGHTSAHQRIKKEPADSNNSHPSYDNEHEHHGQPAPRRQQLDAQRGLKHCDSRDSRPGQQQQLALVEPAPPRPQHSTPAQSAAVAAAASTKAALRKQQQQQQQQQGQQGSEGAAHVKVFFAGVRWGLSLAPAAVRTRQLLARALNDAYVGEILSVGQGEGLTAVFLDASGGTAELGPTKWSGAAKSNAARWKALAKSAARIYVSGPEAAALPALPAPPAAQHG